MNSSNSFNQSQDIRRVPFEGPILVAHQPEFLPWLGFISKAAMGDIYLLLDSVQFKKQNYQNRNRIRTKGNSGWQWLTVPLTHESTSRSKNICDARLANGAWKEEHLRAITFAYSRSPYFAPVFEKIEKIYNSDWEDLCSLNLGFIRYAFEMFGINVPIYRTSELIETGYEITGQKTDLIISMCRAMGARTFVSGEGAREYLDGGLFKENGINLVFQSFDHPEYCQIHGEFMPYMSFIDLLFNHGPNSAQILGAPKWVSG